MSSFVTRRHNVDLAENNVIRFKNITRKKEAIYANFRVKGMRKGVMFTATIAVDIAAAEMHAGEPLESIIEQCAEMGLNEFQNAEFVFEGMQTV